MHLTEGPDWIHRQVEIIRAATDGPFAIGFITPFPDATGAMFDTALEARPPAIAFSFSDPGEWIAPAPDRGSPPDPARDPILYGLSAALVPSVRPAAAVVRSISHDVEQVLRSRPSSLLVWGSRSLAIAARRSSSPASTARVCAMLARWETR